MMRLSENYAIRSESWISSSLKYSNTTFYSLDVDYSYYHDPNSDNFPYVAIMIVADDKVKVITRTLMTIAEALSNTGGIMGFIYVAI